MSDTIVIPLPNPVPEPMSPICQPADTECIKRLVEAFSDCE